VTLLLAACGSHRSPPADLGALPRAVLVDGDGRALSLLLHPLDGGRLTSGFGLRTHPMGGGGSRHEGLDFAAPKGTPVRAAARGLIVEMGWRGGYGRFLRIRHAPHVETAYAHLSGFTRRLDVGDTVEAGEVVGYVGSTGRSTGPHLHYEIRRRGRPVDPLSLPAF
jgi:murein DD-endopeptidase MepM/ murein hydrolase activator NlpD